MKLKLIFSILIVMSILKISFSIEESKTTNNCATVYSECNFSGSSRSFCGIIDNIEFKSYQLQWPWTAVITSRPFNEGTSRFAFGGESQSCLDKSYYTMKLNNPNNNYYGSGDPFDPYPGCLWVYPECNYRGTRTEICHANRPDMSYFKNIASVKVNNGVKAYLYSKSYYQGDRIEVTQHISCLASSWVSPAAWKTFLNVNSIEFFYWEYQDNNSPPEGSIFVYSKTGFRGDKITLTGSLSDTSMSELRNFRVSSLRMNQWNTKVFVNSQTNYGGQHMEINSELDDTMNRLGWNYNNFYSVRIFPRIPPGSNDWSTPSQGCGIVYEFCEFRGRSRQICSDMPKFNFGFSPASLKVGKNTLFTIFLGEYYNNGGSGFYRDNSCLASETNLVYLFMTGKSARVVVEERPDDTPISETCVKLYTKCNYMGDSEQYCGQGFYKMWGIYSLGQFSSIRLGPSTAAVIFPRFSDSVAFQNNYSCFEYLNGINKQTYILAIDYISNPYSSPDKTQPAIGCVTLYSQCDFKGERVTLCKSEIKYLSSNNFKHKLASYRIGKYTSLFLFQNEEFGGRYISLMSTNTSSEVSCLLNNHPNMYKSVTSLKVNSYPYTDDELMKEGCVRLYPSCDQMGDFEEFCGDGLSKELRKFYKSVRVGPNTIGTLYDSKLDSFPIRTKSDCFEKGGNEMFYLKQLVSNLNINVDSKKVSDTAIPKIGCIFLYSECDFKGEKLEVCKDINDLRTQKFYMKIASYVLPKYTNVNFFQFIDYDPQGRYIAVGTQGEPLRVKCIMDNSNHIRLHKSIASLKITINDYPDEEIPAEGCVFLYSKIDYMGEKFKFCDLQERVDLKGDKYNNLWLKSYKIGAKTRLIMWWFGKMTYGNQSQTNLEKSPNSKLQSLDKSKPYIIVEREMDHLPVNNEVPEETCIYFFSECGYRGLKK